MASSTSVPEIRVTAGPLEAVAEKALVVGVFEGKEPLSSRARALDRTLDRRISAALEIGDFEGKPEQLATVTPDPRSPLERVILAGLGPREKLTQSRIRAAAGRAASVLRDKEIDRFALDLPAESVVKPVETARAAVEGVLAGQYRFDRYKTAANDRKTPMRRVTLAVAHSAPVAEIRREAERARIVGEAQCWVRDLQNEPGNSMTPTRLAEEANRLARRRGLRCRVFRRPELRRMRMSALLAVAQGSEEPPALIVLEWTPRRRARERIALVGKGITFDSGGISIKPWKDMWDMKYDMSGGAAVLGAVKAAAELELPIGLLAVVPATENLPSGGALKPGDVIRSRAGVTIEVHSTDAEGRLILADALAFAAERKPDAIIDLATLTGSVVVALGTHASGLFSNDEELSEGLRRAGEDAAERLWPMPIWEEYHGLIKSDIADVKNVGGPYAGSIAAAIFLKRFVGEVPWAHLDIAGTAYLDSPDGYRPKGGAGLGVRLLIRFLEDRIRGRREEAR